VGLVSGLEGSVAFWLAREGSATPTLFDVLLLEGVGKLYDAPNRLAPFNSVVLFR
jgi:hypothetical protein